MKKVFNKEVILYLIFGGMTTAINFVTFYVLQKIWGEEHYLFINVIAFILATSFAFITNKQYVFENTGWERRQVIKEALSFVSARISTFLIIEEFGLWVSVQIFRVKKISLFSINGILLSKIVLAFLVVLVNYVLSKYLIFKRGKEET